MKGTGIIVDGYSTGALLARHLRRLGWNLIHVQSTRNIPKVFLRSFEPALFSQCIIYRDNPEALLDAVAAYRPAFVVAGSEPGVRLADALGALGQLPSNDPRLASRRRNKRAMRQALESHGMAVPRYGSATSVRGAIQVAGALGYPCVVKPPESAGTDSVALCRNATDVKDAIRRIIGRQNVLGIKNASAVVEEYMKGTEYVVDTISWHGQHSVVACWRYKKGLEGDPFAYREAWLLRRQNVPAGLISYGLRTLDALGIRYGAAHIEIMRTPQTFMLVEAGARLHGGTSQYLLEKCTGTSQAALLAETIELGCLPKLINRGRGIPMRKAGVVMFVVARSRGRLLRRRHLGKIRDLGSFDGFKWLVANGSQVGSKRDLFGTVGVVFLSNKNDDDLDNDADRCRILEEDVCVVATR